MVGYADLSARLLSHFLQACETMPGAGGKGTAAGDAVEIGSSVVRAGLPAAGEAAPLLLAVALFVAAGAIILTRAERRNARSERSGDGAESAVALPAHLLSPAN